MVLSPTAGDDGMTRNRLQEKGSLSYARRAYGVKNIMTRSAWKRPMCNGPTSTASGSTYPRRAHQPRSDPHNPAPPRREACESRSASLFLPEPPDAPGKTERFAARGFPGAFWKQPACLACLTWPALAEPLLDRETLSDRLRGIRGEDHSRHRRPLSPAMAVRPLRSSKRLLTAHVCSKLSLCASFQEHRIPDSRSQRPRGFLGLPPSISS